MAKATLIIGNKNYSSWSLRGWLACKMSGLDFDEKFVPLFEDDHAATMARETPASKVPPPATTAPITATTTAP